jgi:asparagine synthase (glutamine-hydrolysing)
MCGVAALFSYHYAALEVDRSELRTIRESMTARGPDGFGEWFSADGRVALGHRRLSVIDLSENAAQPMKNDGGDLAVSFNGEIYNYKELRKGLEQKGHVFKTHSDTEVLLCLYEARGLEMLRELRGMFAFVLWDGKNKTLVLARDPYGIKPLYYADDGWTVRAASQVKALLAGGKVSRLAEPAGISGFFLTGSVPEPYTLYQEIRQVPAGSFMLVRPSGISAPKRYFSVAEVAADARKNHRPVSRREAVSKVREALTESLGYHRVADVPVGVFLSGGVDSAVLAALAHEAGAEGMQAVTLAFEEYRGTARDEAAFAGKIASQYRLKHHVRVVTRREFEEELPRIFDAMDQPTLDGVNAYFVAKAVKELGLKVALSGIGGDELFGGYPSFTELPRMVRSLCVPSRVPFLGELFRFGAQMFLKVSPKTSPKVTGILRYGGSYEGAYFLRRGLFMPWELGVLVEEEIAREGLRRLGLLKKIRTEITPDPGNPFLRALTLESSFYLRNQLLRDADWAGMAHSVEIRTPYVDAVLLRRLTSLGGASQGYLDKQSLSQCPNSPLPSEVLSRPKTGFHIPVDLWMGKEGQGIDGHWSRRWARAVYARFAKCGGGIQ